MSSSRPDLDPEAYKTSWPWYHTAIGNKLTPQGRKLLEDCGVPSEDVEQHIYRVREEAWKIFPFPCIGQFWFIEFGIARHPKYNDVVEYLVTKSTVVPAENTVPSANFEPTYLIKQLPNVTRLLDVGTCLSQDLRMLRSAGVPAAALYGTDVFARFEAIGHQLFLDQASFQGHFIRANVFDDDPNSPLNVTAGLWDVVTASMFLHQFDLNSQRSIAARMIRLLRPCPGSMIVGNNAGQLDAGEVPVRPPFRRKGENRFFYRHNVDTMRQMWEEIVEVYGGKDQWLITCEYDKNRVGEKQGEARFFQGDGQRHIYFSVTRV